MPADLEQLLRDAAPEPTRVPEPSDLARRGTRRRHLRHAGAGLAAASVVALAAIGLSTALERPLVPDVVDTPTGAPAPATPTIAPTSGPRDDATPDTDGPEPDGEAIDVGPRDLGPRDLIAGIPESAGDGTAILVSTQDGVVVVGTDGTPRGALQDIDLLGLGPNGEGAAPGPALLADADARTFIVPTGTEAAGDGAPTGWWPLANDHRLEFTWSLDPGAFVLLDRADVERNVQNVEPTLAWTINDERDLFSRRPAEASPGVYDLLTEQWTDLPDGCLATDRHPTRDAWLLSCATEVPTAPSGDLAAVDELRWSDGGEGSIVATTGNGDPLPGTVTDAWVAPDGAHLLVQHWPADCAAPAAWIAEAGSLSPVGPALTDAGGLAVPSTILGWTGEGAALVYAGVPAGTECADVDQPGLYRVDPATLDAERLWAGPSRVGPGDVQLMADTHRSIWIEGGDSDPARQVVEFLRAPSAATAEAAGIGAGVRTGFPTQLDRTVEDVLDPAAWDVEVDGRGRGGGAPAGVFDLLDSGPVEVGIGDPGHCASSLRPEPPAEVADGHTRHWIRSGSTIESCLQWFVIDIWVRDSDGRVTALTFDLYEP